MAAPVPVPGDLVRIRDERWTVTRHAPGLDAGVLEVRGRDRTNFGARASFLLPFDIVEPLPSSHAPRAARPRSWRRLTRSMLARATPSWGSLRTPLHARVALLAFQLEPALAVTHGLASRVLIADEVGLGKTVQAGLVIGEILDRSSRARVLIVAPASLREQWRTELEDRFGLGAWVADSASLARAGATWTDVNPWRLHPITITSIDYVKRPEALRALDAIVWDAVVFDEAHALAGRSDRAAAAAALARRARTVVMLTATPHTGDDDAFDRLCRIGDLDGGFPLLLFRRTRQDVGLAVSRKSSTLRVRPSLAESAMHGALMTYARRVWAHECSPSGSARLAMSVLVRRASSSAASLARSVERRLALLAGTEPGPQQLGLPLGDMSADEEPGAELAAPGLADREDERRRLEHVLRAARRAEPSESKLRLLSRFLRRTRDPAIVFTEYRDTLERLAVTLREHDPVTLHGGLTAAERRDSLQRFTAGTARLLIATDAASEGLNLQARCRLVINLELPWTPLRLEQRIGRVDRIGQPRRVHAVHLVAANTPEESTVARLLLRTRRAAAVLDGLRPRATEQDIAGTVIGRERFDDAAPELRVPQVLAPGVSSLASSEAARLEKLRSVAGHQSSAPADDRPPVVVRRGMGRRGILLGFRLVFVDTDRRPVWETFLGVEACGPAPWLDSRYARWIELSAPRLEQTIAIEGRRAVAALEASLRTPLALASRRERAIASSIAADRARLAADLLQPGLFDRRAERLRAAQAAVLDEALAHCRAHLETISGTGHPVIERLHLAFAVIRR
ncbi:MAG TPA: DEAD/DEAH box helicase [Vicinamibacterales bacterium]|nr:DEAD/DEAH box helicase [Vicinamibacterales bacterium]